MRDIYKNWCLNGINSSINTIDKTVEMIKSLSKGKKIITVGSSAGGYMAIMFGILLNAENIYAFSPQVSLSKYNFFHKISNLEEYQEDENINKYLELRNLILDYKGNIFYFYPGKSKEDIEQYNEVKDIDRINFFCIKRKEHGSTILYSNMAHTLSMNSIKLIEICKLCKGKMTTQLHFSCLLEGKIKGCINFSSYILKRLLNKIKK